MNIYCMKMFVQIEIDSEEYPDGSLELDIKQKVRNKVLCNRENMKIVELRSGIFEVGMESEVEDVE